MKRSCLLIILVLFRLMAYGHVGASRQQLSFIENKGQIRDQNGNSRTDIDFIFETKGMTLYIGKGQLHYLFTQRIQPDTAVYTAAHPPAHYTTSASVSTSRLDVTLLKADKTALIETEDLQQAQFNYYKGKSVTSASAYNKITYKNIYPNIDWVLYTNGQQLKYDFVVRPGGNVSDIKLKYDGSEKMQLTAEGSLKISTLSGGIEEEKPYCYEAQGKKEIAGKFMLQNNILSFNTAKHNGTLVIDPGVQWATYFGGELADGVGNIFVDNKGYIYISGTTASLSGIATSGAYMDTLAAGLGDAFLTKLDSTGHVIWSTYFGGPTIFEEFTLGLEMNSWVTGDNLGHIYLSGYTYSTSGIATPGSYQDTVNPKPFFLSGSNGYLAQFTENGLLKWSTYYGGSSTNAGFGAAACDKNGYVYAVGLADSSSSTTGALVTTNAHQTLFGGGSWDGLVVKFDSNGKRLWATYYGGEADEHISSVACSDDGNIFISGFISGSYSSSTLATPGTHEDVFHDGTEGFLAKFNSEGVRQWATYLRGKDNHIALNKFNQLYVGGTISYAATEDSLVVSPGCHQSTVAYGSQHNGYLMRFNPENGKRIWGTFYGGESSTSGTNVACDKSGNIFLSGSTKSLGTVFPETIATKGSHQDSLWAPPKDDPDMYVNTIADDFLAMFDSSGKRKWGTYYGGPDNESGGTVTIAPSGAIYLMGITYSTTNIATQGAPQETFNGEGDCFLVRFAPLDIELHSSLIAPVNDTVCSGDVPVSVSIGNLGWIDKTDTLAILGNYSGPAVGNIDTFFTTTLAAGNTHTYNLGNVDLSIPGAYDFTLWLRYTKDDEAKENDTIRFHLFATNALPKADIDVYNVGRTFHFGNTGPQQSETYFWDFGDGTTSNESTPSHEYAVTDSFPVTLVVTNFCGSDTSTIMIQGIGDPAGIAHLGWDGDVSVYPNPAASLIYINAGNGILLEEYSMTNAAGQVIAEGSLETQSINVGSIASGIYYLRIHTNKGWTSGSVQVMH